MSLGVSASAGRTICCIYFGLGGCVLHMCLMDFGGAGLYVPNHTATLIPVGFSLWLTWLRTIYIH